MTDQTGYDMNVNMPNTTSMTYLKKMFAQQTMRACDILRFFMDGERLDEQTPKQVGHCDERMHSTWLTLTQLGLMNGDKIDVFIEQLSGRNIRNGSRRDRSGWSMKAASTLARLRNDGHLN